jgi:alkaline phosphatase
MVCNFVVAQYAPKIHSHNDYIQQYPLYTAWVAEANSIEIDVILKDNQLFVAHEMATIDANRTIESLYLKPLSELLKSNSKDNLDLQLLIDLKTEAVVTLKVLIPILNQYKNLWNNGVEVVISGKRPAVEDYINYPDYIKFDYQSLKPFPKVAVEKIAMVSLSFKAFSKWNGKGRMTQKDLERVKKVIAKAKSLGKPFRFWGTPDSKTAWHTFNFLGLDYINTDQPLKLKAYLKKQSSNTVTDILGHEVKQLKNDFPSNKVKNLIIMIGDGMGLSQISAGVMANNGQLNITQINDIGLIKTSAKDATITDSAAGASAYFVGEKTNNRAIGVNSEGLSLENLLEKTSKNKRNSAIITTDEIFNYVN